MFLVLFFVEDNGFSLKAFKTMVLYKSVAWACCPRRPRVFLKVSRSLILRITHLARLWLETKLVIVGGPFVLTC